MDSADAGALGGAIALAMVMVKILEVAAKMGWSKMTGNGKTNGHCNFPSGGLRELSQTNKEQLQVLHNLDRSFESVKSDSRAELLEISHMQRSIDAVHKRLDDLARACK